MSARKDEFDHDKPCAATKFSEIHAPNHPVTVANGDHGGLMDYGTISGDIINAKTMN